MDALWAEIHKARDYTLVGDAILYAFHVTEELIAASVVSSGAQGWDQFVAAAGDARRAAIRRDIRSVLA